MSNCVEICRKYDITLPSKLCNYFKYLVKFLNGGRKSMEYNFPRYTLRISQKLHKKIDYTAKYNGRSKNKEIEMAIKRYLQDFESLHGVIDPDANFDA